MHTKSSSEAFKAELSIVVCGRPSVNSAEFKQLSYELLSVCGVDYVRLLRMRYQPRFQSEASDLAHVTEKILRLAPKCLHRVRSRLHSILTRGYDHVQIPNVDKTAVTGNFGMELLVSLCLTTIFATDPPWSSTVIVSGHAYCSMGRSRNLILM